MKNEMIIGVVIVCFIILLVGKEILSSVDYNKGGCEYLKGELEINSISDKFVRTSNCILPNGSIVDISKLNFTGI